ncbi:cobalt ABC transporter permease [Roseospira navarrensis]|uniref:Cobalt ABC transporter permease n=1 Tax=Roseospira navarrensis TaxID=140058 RepID=A0A7X2D2L9_9PROT|nr:cobalt ABC transporter permease [Roseospira navarrensis]MQX35841.1 cobalt ABC transporter permease [Roseospira navarrensis]
MTRFAASLATVAFVLILAGSPALAHKVIAGAFPSGDVIEGEVGFSNGEMAADTPVTVFDETGALMGETRTDADGFFVYTPTRQVTHVFEADLGAGHVVTFRLDAAEVPAVAGGAAPAAAPAATIPAAAPVPADLKAMIADAVRDEVRPLRREIAAYKEKNDLQTILGGIGYIIGLFGLAFFLMARRERRTERPKGHATTRPAAAE